MRQSSHRRSVRGFSRTPVQAQIPDLMIEGLFIELLFQIVLFRGIVVGEGPCHDGRKPLRMHALEGHCPAVPDVFLLFVQLLHLRSEAGLGIVEGHDIAAEGVQGDIGGGGVHCVRVHEGLKGVRVVGHPANQIG